MRVSTLLESLVAVYIDEGKVVHSMGRQWLAGDLAKQDIKDSEGTSTHAIESYLTKYLFDGVFKKKFPPFQGFLPVNLGCHLSELGP